MSSALVRFIKARREAASRYEKAKVLTYRGVQYAK